MSRQITSPNFLLPEDQQLLRELFVLIEGFKPSQDDFVVLCQLFNEELKGKAEVFHWVVAAFWKEGGNPHKREEPQIVSSKAPKHREQRSDERRVIVQAQPHLRCRNNGHVVH